MLRCPPLPIISQRRGDIGNPAEQLELSPGKRAGYDKPAQLMPYLEENNENILTAKGCEL
jgi:hypothetical protein